MNKNNDLLVKMFYTHFENGQIMPKRHAIQLDDQRFQIIREDGRTREVTLGEYVEGGGTVGQDHNYNLTIGENTILVGGIPIPGWSANRSNSNSKFHLFNPDGVKKTYNIGDKIPGLGELEIDDRKRISVNGRNIPIFRKEREITLIAFKEEVQGGYKAFFNVNITGEKDNGKNGIKGVFMPGSANKPSRFCEPGPDGNLYATAMIRPNDDGETVRCVMRTLEDAVQERLLQERMKEIDEIEAKPFDISPTDILEYVKLQEMLTQVRGSCWNLREFSVTNGHRLLAMPSKNKYLSPNRGMYASPSI